MSIVRAADAPRFELDGSKFTVFAGPSNGSQQVCAWRLTVPAGHESMPHSIDRDEVFMVLSGQLRVTPDGAVLGAGDSVVVPAGEPIAAQTRAPNPPRYTSPSPPASPPTAPTAACSAPRPGRRNARG